MRPGAAAVPRICANPRTGLVRLLLRTEVREWDAGSGVSVMLPTRGAPAFTMLPNPVQERSLKTDVVPESF